MLVDRLRRFTRRRLVCGDDRLRREARIWAASSVDFELDPNATSHIAWPFVQDDWNVVTGSVFHVGDDYYADDWNWGVGDDDGTPYSQDEENLPCSTWSGDKDACNAHSILFGGQLTQDCAYYLDTDKCRPRGTSNCLAGILSYCEP